MSVSQLGPFCQLESYRDSVGDWLHEIKSAGFSDVRICCLSAPFVRCWISAIRKNVCSMCRDLLIQSSTMVLSVHKSVLSIFMRKILLTVVANVAIQVPRRRVRYFNGATLDFTTRLSCGWPFSLMDQKYIFAPYAFACIVKWSWISFVALMTVFRLKVMLLRSGSFE